MDHIDPPAKGETFLVLTRSKLAAQMLSAPPSFVNSQTFLEARSNLSWSGLKPVSELSNQTPTFHTSCVQLRSHRKYSPPVWCSALGRGEDKFPSPLTSLQLGSQPLPPNFGSTTEQICLHRSLTFLQLSDQLRVNGYQSTPEQLPLFPMANVVCR